MVKTIGNPGSWVVHTLGEVFGGVPRVTRRLGGSGTLPAVRKLRMEDLRLSLKDGVDDFLAFRSDVIFACLLYPVIGLVLAWFAFHNALLPLLFPLVAGFALLGPIAAIGLYEMSRRRERGESANWAAAIAVLGSPALAPILVLGAVLFAIFVAWLGVAHLIYESTLGPEPPASIGDLLGRALTTPPGWAMTVIGFAVGFLFAAVVLAISVVSFPLLIDRDVGLVAAIVTSVRVTLGNLPVIAAWGLIVAVGLAVASVPLFLGLILVMPVLGHATWHLYRRAVTPA